ncbi:SDR family oxidoreductase [Nocardioides carbamazepini]|jgi:NAD(P)-dependent dehydrogenase (short-subunit alcohol dehydrogenase family)|uniref:SDR family NAD(P)-dependent oxidoreductase n=1 Tax=Nocardioides carbamazepini TaxID=2854259 RepID=UPI002149B709|nr:SDR family NAD(P)-dependent oxidoreductase [Nocardioides carbamazepini]MCR1786733.1 SDR family oxidoreductase [Nocardioides carbamazepini]
MTDTSSVFVVTGGAGGLGGATARLLAQGGAAVVVTDLAEVDERELRARLGESVTYVRGDVCSEADMTAVLDHAADRGAIRGLVHCPGRGFPRRIVDRDGAPFPLEQFETAVRLNLVGTFNALRLTAARMATNAADDGERGAIVLTASVAAWDGQVGQVAYAAAKSGVVGMTLCAARDLADLGIRVNTIAPGIFDTPLLARFSDEVREGLGASVTFPKRLGDPAEYAAMADQLLRNRYMNGEVVRLDGAIRMAAR